jgi:hypothetical protein
MIAFYKPNNFNSVEKCLNEKKEISINITLSKMTYQWLSDSVGTILGCQR